MEFDLNIQSISGSLRIFSEEIIKRQDEGNVFTNIRRAAQAGKISMVHRHCALLLRNCGLNELSTGREMQCAA